MAGAGSFSCAEFTKAYRQYPDDMGGLYFSWAQGFMTGLNVAFLSPWTPLDFSRWSVKRQQMYIREYCDAHPLKLYMEAVLTLYDAMRLDQGLPPWLSRSGKE
jgi:hypothetical protein